MVPSPSRGPLALVLLIAACGQPPAITPPPLGALPFPVDSTRTGMVADGVFHRLIHSPEGPWTINVLYVDLDHCNRVEALASSDTILSRMKTTEMLARLSQQKTVLGGVNADFFNLRNGAPTNLLVINGTMRTPPIAHPVLGIDSSGVAHIGVFTLEHDALLPFHPLHAVGGRPVLARDSAIAAEADTFGNAGFRGPNPRTAAGIAQDGRRLILAVIDGRRPQDAGMTLRQTAELMLALGARDAVNLDGGGSTTMVVADSSGELRIVNHPSDKEGERAVGDGLAVVTGCRSGAES
jgi:exopolysaccharide biosynthesis protein